MNKLLHIFQSPIPVTSPEPIVQSAVEKIVPKDNSTLTKILTFSFGPFSTADLIQILLTLLICFLLLKYLVRYIKNFFNKTKIDKGISGFIISILKGLIYIFGTITILEAFGMPVTQMVAIISVLGLAISLSIQNFMTNLMSGITILVSKPYIVDDYVEIDGGSSGTVIKIGLLYTEFKSVDEKILYIPNSIMASGKIINFTRSKTRKIDMQIPVNYSSDVDLVKSILRNIVQSDERIFKDPEPMIRLKFLGPNSMDFMLRCMVNSVDYWSIYFDINEKIIKNFRKNNIHIPYNQLDVHIKKYDSE